MELRLVFQLVFNFFARFLLGGKGPASHDSRRHTALCWLPLHRLRCCLPSGVLLRGRQDALHPPRRMHRLRSLRRRMPRGSDFSRRQRSGRMEELHRNERRIGPPEQSHHGKEKASGRFLTDDGCRWSLALFVRVAAFKTPPRQREIHLLSTAAMLASFFDGSDDSRGDAESNA